MDTQIDHAHMRIKTLGKERSKWERGIPWHQTIKALSRERVSAQLRNNLMHVRAGCMIIQSNNRSINHKVTQVGPPPKPVYFCMT